MAFYPNTIPLEIQTALRRPMMAIILVTDWELIQNKQEARFQTRLQILPGYCGTFQISNLF